jgi:hypothetical protein
VEDDRGVDQSGLGRAQFFGGKTVSLQITWALVGEEDVGILQQVVEPSAILRGVVQDGGAHPNLYVPGKGLDLGGVGPPDVKDVRALHGEVPAHRSSRDHMSHSERADAVERILSVRLETAWVRYHRSSPR